MFIQQSVETGTIRRLDCTLIKTSSLQLLGVDGGRLARRRRLEGDVERVGPAAPASLVWTDVADEYFSDRSPSCAPHESSGSVALGEDRHNWP